jgi:hypothetical protein
MKELSVGKKMGFIVALLLLATLFLTPSSVNAAAFAQTYVRLDRMKASTASTGLVCAQTPASLTAGTEASVKVTFPTGFTVSGTAGNWTVATTDLPSGATAWPGIGTASSVSGQDVTFPSSDISATSTLYCFRWTGGTTLTNSTAGSDKSGSVTSQTSGPATIDSGEYAVAVVSDDQISVTATVPLIYSMTLSGNSMPLGTLSTSSVSSSTARTVTIATNAAAGWVAWIRGANGSSTIGALSSVNASASIAAPDTCANNTPIDLAATTGYVVDVDITTDSGTGTGTVTQASGFGAEYAGSNSTSGGSPCTTLTPIAAANGTTDGDVLTLTARAKVTAVQPAGTDYADTLTVVSAGRF